MSRTLNAAPTISLLSPAVGTGNVGDHFIEAAVRRLLREDTVYRRFSIRRPLTPADIEAINETRCAILCGTNLYQHDWESAMTPEALAGLCVPVIPFGVGGSAARLEDRGVSEATRQMIRALHSRCTLGSVRDPFSAEVVARAGVENFALTGCPVLFWAGRVGLPPVRPGKRSRVVLTARNWLMHRWPDNVNHPVQVALFRQLLASFPHDRLLFAVHEEFDEQLVEAAGIPRRLVFRGTRPEDYARLYADPGNVVLAMRLHAGMLALANGVPALFVAHDTRAYSFCRMMGLDYLDLFAEGCADDCVAQLRALLDGDVSPFAGAALRFRGLRDAMDGFLAANGLPARRPVPERAGGRR
jgi:hypothetical protein